MRVTRAFSPRDRYSTEMVAFADVLLGRHHYRNDQHLIAPSHFNDKEVCSLLAARRSPNNHHISILDCALYDSSRYTGQSLFLLRLTTGHRLFSALAGRSQHAV